jgi:hypothetical protein
MQKKAASKVQAVKKAFRKIQKAQAELDDYEDELLPGNFCLPSNTFSQRL